MMVVITLDEVSQHVIKQIAWNPTLEAVKMLMIKYYFQKMVSRDSASFHVQ